MAIGAVFLLSGLWHGANWTFIVWGGLHAMFLLGDRALSRLPRMAQGMAVFALTTYAWIFFRAASVGAALSLTAALGHGWMSLAHPVAFLERIMAQFGGEWNYLYGAAGVVILLAVDWGLERNWLRPWFEARPAWQRLIAYNAAVLGLYAMWARDQQPFLYFQF